MVAETRHILKLIVHADGQGCYGSYLSSAALHTISKQHFLLNKTIEIVTVSAAAAGIYRKLMFFLICDT